MKRHRDDFPRTGAVQKGRGIIVRVRNYSDVINSVIPGSDPLIFPRGAIFPIQNHFKFCLRNRRKFQHVISCTFQRKTNQLNSFFWEL